MWNLTTLAQVLVCVCGCVWLCQHKLESLIRQQRSFVWHDQFQQQLLLLLNAEVNNPQVLELFHTDLISFWSARTSAPPVRIHNAASQAEGTNWGPCWFSACSALEGFSLQSQRGIRSSTIDPPGWFWIRLFFAVLQNSRAMGKLSSLQPTHKHTH